MDTALKIAKLNLQAKQIETAKELFLAVLDNPAFDLVAGTLAIEYVASANPGDVWYTIAKDIGKSALEITLGTICIAKAIVPALNSPATAALVGPAASALVGKYLT